MLGNEKLWAEFKYFNDGEGGGRDAKPAYLPYPMLWESIKISRCAGRSGLRHPSSYYLYWTYNHIIRWNIMLLRFQIQNNIIMYKILYRKMYIYWVKFCDLHVNARNISDVGHGILVHVYRILERVCIKFVSHDADMREYLVIYLSRHK